ncbi:hypothetical protein [Streptococcus mitis]|nr:hypothetical protein [Streptococcus mitis]
MTLIDEVKRLNSESHAKWFERYFKEYDLEHKIKYQPSKAIQVI